MHTTVDDGKKAEFESDRKDNLFFGKWLFVLVVWIAVFFELVVAK